MAGDNLQLNAADSAGGIMACALLTFSGDSALVQCISPGILSGSEGSWTYSQLVGGAGAVAAGVQRVTLASDDPAVALLGTIDADTSSLAGCVSGTEVQVDVLSCALPAGAATAAKQPALGTAGTPSADVLSVQGVVGGTALPVSGTFWQATQPVSLTSVPSHEVTNAGTFAVQAAQSGTWNITDISGTVSLPTGAATAANQATANASLSSIDDKLPALSFSGRVPVDLTSETVAATQSGAWSVSLESASIEGLATAAKQDVSNASLEIMDDWDSSDDCRSIQQSAAAMDGATRCDVKRFRVKCGTGANTLIAAVASKKFRIRSLAFLATSATAVTAYLSTTTDTGVLGDATDQLTFDLDGGGGPAGVVLPYNPDGWLQTSTANEALTCTLSAAEEVWVIGTYLEVA